MKEVKTEIEKELQAAFKKKEDEALELYNKGNAAYDNNQFKEAISFFSAALEIVKTASFHLARGNSLGNLGIVYRSLGQYDRAIKYHAQALDSFEEIKSPYDDLARKIIAELEAEKG